MVNSLVSFFNNLFFSNEVQILMYHGFCNKNDAFNDGKHVEIGKFKDQIKLLKNNYSLISLSQFYDAYANNTRPPPNAIVITFDDGYASNYELAFSLLEEYKIPVTIYLTTDFINKGVPLWTDRVELLIKEGYLLDSSKCIKYLNSISGIQLTEDLTQLTNSIKRWLKGKSEIEKQKIINLFIKDLRLNESKVKVPEIMKPLSDANIKKMFNSGLVEFGAHTLTHPIMSQCDDHQLNMEISQSIHDVDILTGSKCHHFAYPNGRKSDFDQRSISLLKDNGINTAVTTIEGENNPIKSNMYQLKRIGVHNNISISQFMANLQPIRRRINKVKNLFR